MKKRSHRATRSIENLEQRTLMSHAMSNLTFVITGPASVVAGDDATYQFAVTNAGPGKASVISFTPTNGLPAGTTEVSLTQTSGLPTALVAGQTDVFSLVLKVGSGVVDGTVLHLSSTLNSANNSNTAGDVQTFDTAVTTSADVNLVITGPSQVVAGQNATFIFSSFNAGPSDAATLLDTPPKGFPDGVQQVSFIGVSGPGAPLTAGSSDIYSFVMSVPANLADGTVLTFPEHANGQTPDPVSANNDTVITTTVTTAPVLPVNVAVTTSDASITQGNAVTFSVAVTPGTPGTATPTGTVAFTSDGESLGSAPLMTDGTAILSAPALAVGNHTIIASYSGDTTYIATTGGLTQTVKAVVPSQVVPSFGKVVLPPQVVAGSKIKASLPVTVTNGGPLLLGTYTVTLFADAGTVFDGKQVQIATGSKNITLKPNGHANFAFNLKSLPAALPNGTYYVLAQLTDPILRTNLVSTAQTVTVAAPFVTLTATTAAVTPATVKLNKSGTLTVSITNHGNIDAVGPLTLTLAPSSDGISPIAGITLATLVTRKTTIKVGKTAKFVLHIKHTAAQSPATYFPYATISLAGQSVTAVATAQFALL